MSHPIIGLFRCVDKSDNGGHIVLKTPEEAIEAAILETAGEA